MFSIFSTSYSSHSRDGLKDLPDFEPEPKWNHPLTRWKSINHHELVSTIIKVLQDVFDKTPYTPSERYFVSPNGAILIGGFEIQDSTGLMSFDEIPQTTTYCLGFKHGNDTKHALSLAAGGKVLVCENGMISGKDKFKHKHTKGLKLYDWVRGKLGSVFDVFRETGSKVRKLLNFQISPSLHDALLLHFARHNLISWIDLGRYDRDWMKSFEGGPVCWTDKKWDFTASAWDWYNQFTHFSKKFTQSRQYELFDKGFSTLLTLAEV